MADARETEHAKLREGVDDLKEHGATNHRIP